MKGQYPGLNYVPSTTGNAPFDAKTPPFDENGVYPNLLGARGLHPGPEGNQTPTMVLLNKGK